MTLADLHKGETGTILQIVESPITSKLMDMGCIPGESITLKYKAPFGDPLCVKIVGYDLVLRVEEALSIQLQK